MWGLQEERVVEPGSNEVALTEAGVPRGLLGLGSECDRLCRRAARVVRGSEGGGWGSVGRMAVGGPRSGSAGRRGIIVVNGAAQTS